MICNWGTKIWRRAVRNLVARRSLQCVCRYWRQCEHGDAESLQIGQPATSLKIETQQTWDLTATRKALQHQFVEDLSRFRKEGFASFHALCERLLAYKGKTVRCFDSQHEWIGVCESLNEDGRLNLRMADGSLHTLSSGELRLRSV